MNEPPDNHRDNSEDTLEDILVYPRLFPLQAISILGRVVLILAPVSLLGNLLILLMLPFLWTQLPPAERLHLLALVPLLLMGFFLMIFALRLMRPLQRQAALCIQEKQPWLIVNADGIVDNILGSGVGLIRWEDIVRVEARQYGIWYCLVIVPQNADALFSRLDKFRAWHLRLNARLGRPPFLIAQRTLTQNVDELVSRIQAYRAAQA